MRISLISVALASALLLTSCSASAAATSSVTETAATTEATTTAEATTTTAETTPRVTKINSTYLDVDKALFLAVPAGFEADSCAPFPYSDEMVTPGEQYEGAYPNYAFALKDGTTVSYVVVEFKPDSETFKNLTVGSKVKFSYTNEEGKEADMLEFTLTDDNPDGWEKLDTGRREGVYAVDLEIVSAYRGKTKPNNACMSEILLVQNTPAEQAKEPLY